MISEFEVIRMLLEIQGAPAEPPAEMIVKTKDAIIREGIKKMLDRVEKAQKQAECDRKQAEMAQASAAAAEKPAKKAEPPLIREKEMLQAKITQPPSGGGQTEIRQREDDCTAPRRVDGQSDRGRNEVL